MERKRSIRRHTDLEVYQRAYKAAMQIFTVTKGFPKEERYALVDQVRRSSRSVCANLAEAWRKRRYEGAFVGKLSDCEGEAAETQTWLQFATDCGYLEREVARKLYAEYDAILSMIVHIINHPKDWTIC